MKRFISFALACLMLVFFVGCDKEEVNYSFKSGEVGFSVHHDADAVIEKLGDPIDLVETPSCGGGEEPDREYTYSGFKINTINENGLNKIVKIVLTDDSVSTPEGISIGSSRDEVIAAYGSSFTENATGTLTYTDGTTKLMIGIKDGAVSAIHYVEE